MLASERLLVAEDLACSVDGRQLFADVSCSASRGELLEVRGPNGCGKSTLLRCLAGLRRLQAGRVTVRGEIAYVGHKAGMSELLTPLENTRWLLRLRGRHPKPSLLEGAFLRVGLGAARYEPCGALSAGQLRRAALARLLLCEADLWLLDEPMTAMDAAGAALVRQLIGEHRAAGGVVVSATHRALEEADQASATVLNLA